MKSVHITIKKGSAEILKSRIAVSASLLHCTIVKDMI